MEPGRLRAGGDAKTDRGEIKIVPSASYDDYNLYWYARSFEVGGNQGVYWDNWFFIVPTYNTEMTDAYRRPDGTIVPATGIWELRELAKRTFIMMNERKMLPYHLPAHDQLQSAADALLRHRAVRLGVEIRRRRRARPLLPRLHPTGDHGDLAGNWASM